MNREQMINYRDKIKDAWKESSYFDKIDPDNVPGRKELWNKIWSDDVGRYERLLSLFRFLHKFSFHEGSVFTFEKKRMQEFFSKHLPINEGSYHFERKVGSGGEANVYLLQSNTKEKPSWVLKILRPSSKGLSPLDQIKERRNEEAKALEIYKEAPELISKEEYLLVHDPMTREQVSGAVIQTFEGGELKDFFDFTPEDIAKKSESFRHAAAQFCRITLDHERKCHEILDINGGRNIVVIENAEDQSQKLRVLDAHNMILTDTHEFSVTGGHMDNTAIRRTDRRIIFLKEVLMYLGKGELKP